MSKTSSPYTSTSTLQKCDSAKQILLTFSHRCKQNKTETDVCEGDPNIPFRFYEIEVIATNYGGHVGHAKVTVIIVPQDVNERFFSNGTYSKSSSFFIDMITGSSARHVLKTKGMKFDTSQ